jgi:hypothetical protein
MSALEPYIAQIWSSFFAEADKIRFLLSSISFAIGVLLAPFAFEGKDTAINRRRFCGAFLLLSVTFESSNAGMYALTIFIIATLITELNFLSSLAAIFWNRSWAFQRPASEAEITAKLEQEAAENAEDTKIEIETPSARKENYTAFEFAESDSPNKLGAYISDKREKKSSSQRQSIAHGLAFEQDVFTALERANLFEDIQGETALTTNANPGAPLAVVDAIGMLSNTRYVIEVKQYVRNLEQVVAQIRFAMTALKNTPELQRKLFSVRIKGILIINKEHNEIGRRDFLADDIACLYFDPVTHSFTNISRIQNWIKGSR